MSIEIEIIEDEQRKDKQNTFVAGALAFILPFVIYGAKVKLEDKFANLKLYCNTEQKQVYEVTEDYNLRK